MAVAFGSRRHTAGEPVAGVGIQREVDPPPTAHLRARDRHLGSGGVLPIGVVVAADEADRAQHRDGELPSRRCLGRLGQLVLGQVREQDGKAARVDPAVRRVGRERLLAVTALSDHPALDDGELALGVRRVRPSRDRGVEAHSMVVRVVDEGEADPDERLIGPQLDLHGDVGHLRLGGPSPIRPPARPRARRTGG